MDKAKEQLKQEIKQWTREFLKDKDREQIHKEALRFCLRHNIIPKAEVDNAQTREQKAELMKRALIIYLHKVRTGEAELMDSPEP